MPVEFAAHDTGTAGILDEHGVHSALACSQLQAESEESVEDIAFALHCLHPEL